MYLYIQILKVISIQLQKLLNVFHLLYKFKGHNNNNSNNNSVLGSENSYELNSILKCIDTVTDTSAVADTEAEADCTFTASLQLKLKLSLAALRIALES